MFLLDTVVISEMRKERPNARVVTWMKKHETEPMYLSVITIGEIERGIVQVRGRDPRFASQLETWLQTLLLQFGDCILPVQLLDAQGWGRSTVSPNAPLTDALLAATAKVRGLTVVTRNETDFRGYGVKVVNPFR